MKKLFLSTFMLSVYAISLFAQNAKSAAELKKGDPLKDYLRPSLSVIYLDRGESLSNRLIAQMAENGIPGKFDDNSVEHNVLSIKGDVSEEYLRQALEEHATKEIMYRWLPEFDREKGEWSLAVVHERGRYNASDADFISAAASDLGESILKDRGLDMLNRSYIVVYDFYDTQKISANDSEGYSTNCNVYLYHLDWSDEMRSAFDVNFDNPNAIEELTFPVKFVGSIIGKSNLTPVKITQSNAGSRMSDEKLFQAFTKEIEKAADVYLTQINEDFRVKSTLFATSPLRAKIGTKEGVTVDQRYYVYERRLSTAGLETAKRKGVVRATSKIVKNDTIASGEGGTTKFYQTYGLKLHEGMTMQQKADWGVGITARGGTDISILGEFSVGMWLGKLLPSMQNLKVPYGSKMYIRLDVPLSPMQDENGNKYLNEEEEMLNLMFAVGISKDFYFARQISFTPFVGVTSLIQTESTKDKIEELSEQLNKSTSNIEIGANLSFAILDNLQIVGSASYNGLKDAYFAEPMAWGIGLRLQF